MLAAVEIVGNKYEESEHILTLADSFHSLFSGFEGKALGFTRASRSLSSLKGHRRKEENYREG